VSSCNFWHTKTCLCALVWLDCHLCTPRCSIKNALAHTRSCFSCKVVSICLFSHMRLLSVSRTFPLFWLERMSPQLLTYKAAFLNNSLLWSTCLTQVLRPREVFTHKFCLTRTRFSGRSERTMRRCQCKRHVSAHFWLTKRLVVCEHANEHVS